MDYAIDTLYDSVAQRLFLVAGTHDGTSAVFHVNQVREHWTLLAMQSVLDLLSSPSTC